MKKRSYLTALIVFTILFTMFLPACRSSTSLSVGLSVKDKVLAVKTDGQWNAAESNVFQRGDIIGLAMLNVSGFKKGEDNLNWMEIDVHVKGPDGEVILDEKELLGEAGHIDMENNTAESPVGSFYTSTELEPGEYIFTVTVYDKVGNGKVTHSEKIILE